MTAAWRNGNPELAAQVARRERVLVLKHGRERSGDHDLAPMTAGARPQVDHVVRRADRFLVVLHHQHGVAQVAQVPQGREQPLVVPVVQPDRGLVQDVEHAHEPAADLRGEPDPLRLTSRERRRRTAEGKVFEADVLEEP